MCTVIFHMFTTTHCLHIFELNVAQLSAANLVFVIAMQRLAPSANIADRIAACHWF